MWCMMIYLLNYTGTCTYCRSICNYMHYACTCTVHVSDYDNNRLTSPTAHLFLDIVDVLVELLEDLCALDISLLVQARLHVLNLGQ